jgi:hypothetical protein
MESVCQRKRYSSSFLRLAAATSSVSPPPILKILGGFTVKANLIPSHFCSRVLQLCAALALLCLPSAIRAQDTGYITGTVIDNSGAAVTGAQVTIVTITGNLTRETVTNSDGVYTVAGLPGATYTITVTAAGFQKFVAKRVVLDVAQKARVDVQLAVGAVTQEVIVNGEDVAQVDTQSAEIGATITGKQVEKLELNGRNFTQLVTLTPGVVNQTGQDEGTVGIAGNVAYSINGGRTEYNNWEIDGGDNMDNGSNTSLNVYPSLDSIAEFKVLTSNYGAQYGRNASGTVEVELRSGTKEFHGTAYEYLRNDFFNANTWANNGAGLPRSAYKKHDFGYTIGGPVYIPHLYNPSKQKTFFFWSNEFRREKVPSPNGSINQPVPSDAERGGDFNDVCPVFAAGSTFNPAAFPECPSQGLTPSGQGTPFVNNTVPITSTGQALVNLLPKANNFTGLNGTYGAGQAAGSPIPTYVNSPSYPTTWREELIRIDHNLTDNERLSFHYIHDSWKTVNQGPLWGIVGSSFDTPNTNFVGPATSFVARLTSNFTPTLLNEFVASYTADHINLSTTTSVAIPASGIDLVPLFPTAQGGALPTFTVGNTLGNEYGGGGFSLDTGYFPWKNANPTYTYRDNLTKIIGTHTLIFGAYFAAAQKNQESTVFLQGALTFATNNPNTTGNPFADLLVGQVAGFNQTSAQPLFYDRYKILEPYFQDDWRVTKRFTLNLGLRWSFFGRYQEKFDREAGFTPSQFQASAAPALFPFNDPVNSQLLDPTTGDIFNGFITCGKNGAPTGCERNKLINPAPRFGFAWDPLGNGKWAIRGGYGIFFEHSNGNEANAESLQGGPSMTVLNGAVGSVTGYANIGSASQGGGAVSPLSPISIPDRVQWPYVQQWNLDVQHELPGHVVMQVSYVGSKGTHLNQQLDSNQLFPVPAAQNPYPAGTPITANDCNNFVTDGTGLPISTTISTGAVVTGQAAQNLFIACGNPAAAYFRPFKGYNSITRLENSANSTYNALQVELNRTLGDLTFSASYTYSHSLDDSSDRFDGGFVNSYDLPGQHASSNFDERHVFTLSYVYALPFFKQPGWTHTLLGGWQASGITTAQTGVPFTVSDGSTFGDNAGVAKGSGTSAYLDVVGNPNVVPASQQAQFAGTGQFGVLRYNPAAFDLPTGLTFGNSGRNELRLPGQINFDFGLLKRFAFKERYAFEFRWENFNIFNHVNLNQLSGGTSSGGAGLGGADGCPAFNAGDPSCAGNGFLVLDGAHSPRIMQFSLRFSF